MYAVFSGALKHFPAQRLSAIQAENVNYTYFDDFGNKVDSDKVEQAASEEIERYTVRIDGTGGIDALSAAMNGQNPIQADGTRLFPVSETREELIAKINKMIEEAGQNG